MVKKVFSVQNFIFVIILILFVPILKMSHELRSNSGDTIPKVHLDEYTWVWQGISVKKSGIPAGWSDLDAYTKGPKKDTEIVNFNINADKKSPNFFEFRDFPKPLLAIPTVNLGEGDKQIRYVQPMIEQPPLGGIVLSSFVPKDVRELLDVKPADIRKSALLMSTLTGILTFILGWLIFKNPVVAFLAGAFYGSVPSFLLLSRYALPENVLTPVILLSFILLVISNKLAGLKQIFSLVTAGVLMGLATLVKITGWPFILAAALLMINWNSPKSHLVTFILLATLVGLIYFIWAILLDSKLFFEILFSQGLERKFAGSINSLVAIIGVNTANFPLDGWWIGGFLALFLIPYQKDYFIIYLGVLTTLISILFLGGSLYSWYLIPAIPFLCLATAFFFWRVAIKPDFKSILVFFFIFLSSSFYWGYGVFKADQPFLLYRLLMIFFIASGFLSVLFTKNHIYKLSWFILISLVTIQIINWNNQSMLYILSNWGNLIYQFRGW